MTAAAGASRNSCRSLAPVPGPRSKPETTSFANGVATVPVGSPSPQPLVWNQDASSFLHARLLN